MSSAGWQLLHTHTHTHTHTDTHTLLWCSENHPDIIMLPNCTRMIWSLFSQTLRHICCKWFFLSFFLLLLFFLNGSQNPFRHLFNQRGVCQTRGSRSKTLQWALWRPAMASAPRLKRRADSPTCAGAEHRGRRQLTGWNLSHCRNGCNYTKKRAIRLNCPWYAPWVMTEIQKVKWHQELNDFWH